MSHVAACEFDTKALPQLPGKIGRVRMAIDWTLVRIGDVTGLLELCRPFPASVT